MERNCENQTGNETREGLIEGGVLGQRRVTYSIVNGKAIFEGDIDLKPMLRETGASASDLATRGVIVSGKRFRWPSGVVPFRIDPALTNAQNVVDAIAHWRASTPMVFVQRQDGQESNFVTFGPGDACSSSVGMTGGEQTVELGAGCGRGNAIHEIGHAVGLWHEQGREDRDQFVRINWENIEDAREHNFNQHISNGDDVGSYDFGSIMHYDEFAFSTNGMPTIETLNGEDVGQRNGLSAGDMAAVQHMYFPVMPVTVGSGVHTLRQRSNGRFLDAHEYAAKDFGVVTRTAQGNDTQRWIVRPVGGIFSLQQLSNNRFVDAHEHAGEDFRVVTRPDDPNDTQRWIVMSLGDGEYTIRQASSGRFLDAYVSAARDFSVVTRPETNSHAQRWLIRRGPQGFTLQQKSSGRLLDAHEIESKDYKLVTRPAQNNSTQYWAMTPFASICTIQQLSNRRYLDAYKTAARDHAIVTREARNDDDQRWLFRPKGGNVHTIEQWSSRRFMDAHEIAEVDFRVVTRPEQDNNTQEWLVEAV